MLSVRDLDKAFNNGNLFELLKIVSDEELVNLCTLVECDDIIGIRINILDSINSEIKSRQIGNNEILIRK